MTLEHMVFSPLLAGLGVGVPVAIFEGPYEAAIIAGLVVIMVKLMDVAVERINGKKNGNGTSVGLQCVAHASQVGQALEELRAAAKELNVASQTLHGVVGRLDVMITYLHPRRED
jgi:hypothetical protein